MEDGQQKLEEMFPIVASGSYVRDFKISSICWPFNWTYLGHKDKEKIEWEYRGNSKKLPFFIYREKYSWTTIQVNFSIARATDQVSSISSMYLDNDELSYNQSQFDAEMRPTPQFKEDYLVIQPEVNEGDMLKNICKFDRKLGLALSSLNHLSKSKRPIVKIPIERMFSPVRKYFAIPFVNELRCEGEDIPSQEEILEYARTIWDKFDF